MTDTSPRQTPAGQIPPDDPARRLATASPDRDESLEHLGVVGDTYTILLSGRDTAGRYTLIDMHVPPGGGPPPHRHDFEEMFSIIDGEIELTFRGQTSTARTGTPSIFRPTPHMSFATQAIAPHGCSASAPPPDRRTSSARSAFRWPTARRRRLRSMGTRRRRSWPRLRLSRRSTEPSFCSDRAKPKTVTTRPRTSDPRRAAGKRSPTHPRLLLPRTCGSVGGPSHRAGGGRSRHNQPRHQARDTRAEVKARVDPWAGPRPDDRYATLAIVASALALISARACERLAWRSPMRGQQHPRLAGDRENRAFTTCMARAAPPACCATRLRVLRPGPRLTCSARAGRVARSVDLALEGQRRPQACHWRRVWAQIGHKVVSCAGTQPSEPVEPQGFSAGLSPPSEVHLTEPGGGVHDRRRCDDLQHF